MTTPISNSDDLIYSLDVIARIEQLQAILEPGPVPDGVLNDDDYDTDQDTLFAELATLEALAKEASDYAADWQYGETLIRDSYFQQYAQELADDIGAVPSEYSWPTSCIDWEQAARELQMDYTSIDFNGVTYWIR